MSRKPILFKFVPSQKVNNVITAINFCEAEALSPCMSIKTLGMLFDNKLNLSDHLTKCYVSNNFKNLGKIASKSGMRNHTPELSIFAEAFNSTSCGAGATKNLSVSAPTILIQKTLPSQTNTHKLI